jgi:asparagine synthase (glutamine-hydrolysing)
MYASAPSLAAVFDPGEPGLLSASAISRRDSGTGSVGCLVDGHLRDTESVRLALGAPPGSAPERLVALGYLRWGDAVLERLRGDFALLLWDHETESGLVARDQLGHRSVHLAADGPRLVIGAEVRDVLRMLRRRPGPDHEALVRWLVELEVPAGRTLYEGVRELPPGHFLALGRNGWAERPYWRARYRPPERIGRADAVDAIRLALRRAVRSAVPVDAPVGITLSGGLDSSIVAGVAASDRPLDLRAYSATFPGRPSMDESELIRLTAGRLGLPSTRVRVSGGSVLAGNVEYLAAWQQPASSPNVFFWLPLGRRAARDGVTVLLDGEGGDEVFGLSPYLVSDRLMRGRLAGAARLAHSVPGGGGLASDLQLLARYGVKGCMPGTLHAFARRVRSPARFSPAWLTRPAARAYARDRATFAWKEADAPRSWAWLVDSMTRTAVYGHIRRRAAMTGLEARHPLHDLDLVETVLGLPPQLAYDRRFYRPLLREAVRGLIPEEVRLRPSKSYFDPIFLEGMARHDLLTIRRLLTGPRSEIGAFVRADAVQSLLSGSPVDHPTGWRSWAREVMALAGAECWLRAQADPAFPGRLLASGELAAPTLTIERPLR